MIPDNSHDNDCDICPETSLRRLGKDMHALRRG